MDKTIAFFARISTVFGSSKGSSLWGKSDKRLQLMRREYAEEIGNLSADQIEEIFTRLKIKRAAEHEDFEWPDLPKILNLIRVSKRDPSHKVFPAGLPEPEWVKEERRERGRLAAKTCRAVLNGSACFLEEKPSED